MKPFRLGSNFAIFIMFFGMALIEAITGGRVLLIVFWFAVAILFFLADNRGVGSRS